ncbi:MAG TPA: TonB-dependent receptor [Allosphingosinicella sp.]
MKPTLPLVPRLLAAIALLACPGAAFAQEAGAGGRTVYQAAYFTAFSPSNALELVRRVPGFTLELGSQEVRGFGQAAGNVVINGARPSSKSDTLETILARIPATSVARVEVGPGDLFGAEYSGKAQVLNLVLTSAGGLAGTATATLRRDFSGQVTPEGSVSALYRRGRSSFNASAGYNNSHSPEEGTDVLTRLPGREVAEFRRKYNDVSERNPFLTGAWAHDAGPNRTAHLNFRVARDDFELNQTNGVFPAAGPVRDDRLSQNFRTDDYELGGDVTRPLLGGGLKLIGLATRRHRKNSEVSLNRVGGSLLGGFAQETDSVADERVLRTVWSRPDLGGWSVESGVEGVFNRLDSDVNLYEIESGGGRSRIDLPVDQATVTEWRGEAFVNAGRALSPALRIDLGLTFEASRLTVRGDAEAERSLRFLKPKAVIDWKPGDGWHAQLSVARTVAQLNFEDFVSSAELANDRVDAGNADLVPQRAWEGRLTVERPVLGDGLAKIELGYNHIALIQDRVPTPEGFDAPGNLGTGRQAFARATLDAPLGNFGIKGGRLTLNGTYQATSVEDPYTHRNRRFSGFSEWEFEATFRQDLGKFAWGLTYEGRPRVTYFRRNETDSLNSIEPYVTAFAEYRPSQATTVTLGVDNIFDLGAERDRYFYRPDRRTPLPYEHELRARKSHTSLYLRLKQSFG